MVENALGRTAENEFPHPRVAVRTHDEQVDLVLADICLEHVADRSQRPGAIMPGPIMPWPIMPIIGQPPPIMPVIDRR
jgi:hypothetical protein